MGAVTRDFAGAERKFHLRLGSILDLEEACGRVGFGGIFKRLSTHEYFVSDIRHVLRLGLIGGGMDASEAKRLIDARIDIGGLAEMHGLAIDVVLSVTDDIPPDATQPAGDPERPIDIGKIFAAFAQMGVPPQDVREMAYSDYVVMARAMAGDSVQPPGEDEFAAMLARSAERYGE